MLRAIDKSNGCCVTSNARRFALKSGTIGLITYHFPHLKTEQVMQNLILKGYRMRLYALPFKQRKQRDVIFQHRPSQSDGMEPELMAKKHGIEYIYCETDGAIDSGCDIYMILGAGILSAECVEGKKIINAHPGIIPSVRGLDAFKWAIHDMKPLGVTLHYIDAQVDAGEIISIIPTNVYRKDTLATLARRHYENEINMMSRFEEYLECPVNPFSNIAVDEARRRMPIDTEKMLSAKFLEYSEKYGD